MHFILSAQIIFPQLYIPIGLQLPLCKVLVCRVEWLKVLRTAARKL